MLVLLMCMPSWLAIKVQLRTESPGVAWLVLAGHQVIHALTDAENTIVPGLGELIPHFGGELAIERAADRRERFRALNLCSQASSGNVCETPIPCAQPSYL